MALRASTMSACRQCGTALRQFSAAAAQEVVPPQAAQPAAIAFPTEMLQIGPSTTASGRMKFKNSFKRASEVMSAVNQAHAAGMAVKMAHIRPPLPKFDIGDAIEVNYAQELSETNPIPVRGTVVSMTNRGLDSKFTILNAWDGEYYTASYVYATPLLRGLKVLMRNRLKTSGLKVRRAKLTYLYGADPNIYLVDQHTKEPDVIAAEKEERRRLAKLGKLGKKKAGSERAGAASDKAAAAKGGAAPAKAAAPAAAAKGGAKK